MRYPNYQIAEIFVEHQGKIDAKSYSKHYHCEHGVLYSYSTPIAIWSWRLKELYAHELLDCPEETVKLPSDIIFLTEHHYSITTGKHEGYLHYSRNGKEIIEIPCEIDSLMNKPGEIVKEISEEKEKYGQKLLRARKEWSRNHWTERLENVKKVAEILRPVAVMDELKNANRR
jgi:hypothetical protein